MQNLAFDATERIRIFKNFNVHQGENICQQYLNNKNIHLHVFKLQTDMHSTLICNNHGYEYR